jgi:uncharacterized protein (DUF2141 family)
MRFLLFFIFFITFVFSYTLNIKIDNIESKKGYIYLSIYKNQNNFLDRKKAYKNIILKAQKKIDYKVDLKKGVYAITVFHDENSNGILDRNFFHFPKEGYGFSTNPFLFGKPTFSDAEFPLKENQIIKIDINY